MGTECLSSFSATGGGFKGLLGRYANAKARTGRTVGDWRGCFDTIT